MYGYEIQNFIKQKLPHHSTEIVSIDTLLYRCPDAPSGYIINLSKSSEQGSHWVALYFDPNGKATYFDSYGFKPRNREINQFIRLHSKSLTFNKKQLQQLQSKVCGHYSCVFLYYMFGGIPLDRMLSQFSPNLKINDKIVEDLYENISQSNSFI
jgi:Adenovirus endoprotease